MTPYALVTGPVTVDKVSKRAVMPIDVMNDTKNDFYRLPAPHLIGACSPANGRKLFDSSQKSTSRENSGMTESDASRQPVRWLLPFWVMIATLTTAPSGRMSASSWQLPWQHQFQFAGWLRRHRQGFYWEAGLQVTLREAGPGTDVINEVTTGRAQFGIRGSDLPAGPGSWPPRWCSPPCCSTPPDAHHPGAAGYPDPGRSGPTSG